MGKKHKKEHKKKRHRSRSSSDSFEKDEKDRKRHHKRKHKKEKKHCKKQKRDSSSSQDSNGEVIEVDTPSPPPAPFISDDVEEVSQGRASRGRASSPRGRTPSPKDRTPPSRGRSPSPKVGRSNSTEGSPKVHWGSPKGRRARSPGGTPPPPPSSSKESLSIEESNALRIKLGLKPLQVENKPVAPPPQQPGSSSTPSNDVILIEGEEGQFVHKPAENLTHKRESEKIRSKLAERKAKREIESKYKKVKTLAEDLDSDTASAWVAKSRKIEVEKQLAAKRAQELDEMDKIFGVSDLIEDEIKKEKKNAYSSKNLKGLTVEHDIETFDEGKNVILTLKDKAILDEDNADTLVNVNMLDDERYKQNIYNKRLKPGASMDDFDDEDIEFGEKTVLKKYDEEILGQKKSSFTIGDEHRSVISKDKVKQKLRANMILESLDTKMEVASDYYTSSEMSKFKKPKKLRKIRKKPLKADDILKIQGQSTLASGSELGSRKSVKYDPSDELDVDDNDPVPDEEVDIPFKIEVKEEETEVSMALKKARKLRQIREKPIPSYLEVSEKVKIDIKDEPMEDDGINSIVLNSTAEFCRTLGDIPTYGLAGNRDEIDQITEPLDFDKEIKRENNGIKKPEEDTDGGWQDAQMDSHLVDISSMEVEPILDAEPDLGSGVAGALRMAVSKGYLEKETANRPNAARFTHLQAQNYSIEDKAHGEEEKFGRRDRYMGPTTDFKERDNYKPNIKLEYIDDEGRILSAKEAFRYLSHKFHGKGPGKNKIEKRMKKNEQEVLMKQMSSSDTPLGTLQMLQHKQVETQSPYVVLSGSKHQLSAPTSISKSKFPK